MMVEQKKVYTIPFDGKTSSYLLWKQQIWCYLCLRKCQDVMSKPVEQFFTLPDKIEVKGKYDESEPDKKIKIDWLKNNALAYSLLMFSQSDIVTKNAISSAKTADLPNGYSWQPRENTKVLHLSE
jgi:hypothetical protein